MDTLVLDIETKNTFADVGGRQFLNKLEISVACVYSYARNEYTCFDESQFAALKKLLAEPATLVGFSSNKFDLPLLTRDLGVDLMRYPRIDLSDEVELKTGRLISLDALAKLNLGKGKTGQSVAAKDLYNAGKMEELKAYCTNDVRLTKELYDFVKKNGHLLIPDKSGDSVEKINIKLEAAGW